MGIKLNPIVRRVYFNQNQIVKELREYGMSVSHTHIIGKGFPDIVVGYLGKNYLFEVKNNRKKKITEKESVWLDNWQGQVNIIQTAEQGIKIIEKLGI